MSVSNTDLNKTPSGIAYRTIGDAGPWLVMCHGMALDHRDLEPFARRIAGEWRVLLWDMPGHGDSAAPARWTLDTMTDALEEVLSAAQVDRCALLGFSFGGMVAQDFVRRHASRVRALVAYGCFAPFVMPPPVPQAMIGGFVAATYGWQPWPRLRGWFARHCAVEPTAQATVAAVADKLGKRGFLAMTRALLRGFALDPNFRIDCPLLLVRGALDANAAGIDAGFGLLSERSGMVEQAMIERAGHCAHLDQPELFAAAVRPFLDRIRPGVDAASR